MPHRASDSFIMARPIIGITADRSGDTCSVARSYGQMVWEAGGLPMVLTPMPAMAEALFERCDGLILTGGDDPNMEQWGIDTHPKAKRIHHDRQAFELALLELAAQDAERPVLGVCLGMQLMALHAGGELDQHLHDTLPTHAQHWGKVEHAIEGALGSGTVHSHHRQAMTTAGNMDVVAIAHDEVIEAVRSEDRPYYLGVQWHPERTSDTALSMKLFEDLVHAAR